MFWISTSGILGISLNRVNVAGLATVSTTNQFYFPAWTEWTVTAGILAGAALVFLFCVENFKVFGAIDRERLDAVYTPRRLDHGDWRTIFFQHPLADARIYSVALVVAVGLALVFMPQEAVFGLRPEPTPAEGPRIVEISNGEVSNAVGVKYSIPVAGQGPDGDPETLLALMIDGNRDGDYVLFDHEKHVSKQGGGEDTCVLCHHMQKPYEEVSECTGCHSDMYLAVDIFDHDTHVEHKNGNQGCIECHTDPDADKVRDATKDCRECHETMRPEGTRVDIVEAQQTTMAPGYMDALHEACISCHEEEMAAREEANGDLGEDLTLCTNCHRDVPHLEDEEWKTRL
jgi:nitrate/TMAO reductase-like tetraheme cytochrome c subunit